MIEVISAHMQNAYTGLRERSFGGADSGGGVGTPGADVRPGQAALRRFSAANKNKHFDDRQIERLLKEKSLYRILETPTSLAVSTVKRPFVGVSCSKCAPSSSVANKSESQNVINILKLGYKLNQDSGFFGRTFCDFSQAYRAKKFNYKQVSETVMADERLKQALSQLTQEALDKQEASEAHSEDGAGAGDGVAVAVTPTKKRKRHVPRTSSSIYKELEKRARFILTDMRSTISDLLLRITSWTLYKVLPYFVTSVVASPDQLEVLRKAGDSGLPLIFVPLHRSHLDYILVSFILLNYNVQSPLVAAGDNLKIPLFGWLLRGLGAFYIKRNTGSEKDIMYKAALHTYMMHCLRARHNIEFFIEGGRSRTGKPQLPKGGILSVIVDAYLDGTIEDALLVPVSMNYEKLVDGNFVREQLGTPKQMETFGGAMKSIYKVLNSHYGSIRIDFNQPFSMRELVQSFRKPNQSTVYRTLSFEQHTFPPLAGQNSQPLTIKMLSYERTMTTNSSCASLFGSDCVSDDQKGLVEAIARHVVYDCTNATAIMSTNAVAFVLLTRFRLGCSLAELVTAVEGLTQELLLDGRSVGYIGDMVDVVNHAINILGPGLVIKENDSGSTTVKPVSILPNIIELSYYGNCLLPHYVIQSVVVTALEVLIADQPSSSGLVSWKDLMDMSLELCEILSQEFILCKPCQDLEDYVRESIHKVSCKDWIRVLEREDYSEDQMQGVRMSHSVLPMDCADEDYPVETKVYYMVNRTDECTTEKKYLQTVLQPLIDVYSVTAQCLPKLLATENGLSTHMSEADFVREVIEELKQMLEAGTCQYGEALSTDAIKNCLRLLRMWGVIHLHANGRKRNISIAKQYHSHEKLKHIGDLISRFRTQTPPQQEQTDSQVKR